MVEGAGGKVEEHTIHSVVGEGERTRTVFEESVVIGDWEIGRSWFILS